MAVDLRLAEFVEGGQVRHDGGADAETAGVAGDLVAGEIETRDADVVGCADARFGDRGDSQVEDLLRAGGDDVRHIIGGGHRNMVGDDRLRRLLQQALRPAFAVGGDVAALGGGHVPALRVARDLERLRVGHTHVSGVVHQVDGMPVADLVQLLRRRVRAEVVLVVTLPDDPRALVGVLRVLVDRREQILHRLHHGGPQIHLQRRLPEQTQV